MIFIFLCLAWLRPKNSSVLITLMAVDPVFETSFCIPLVGTKHFLVRNKTLKDRGNSHVVYAHEHASNEPRCHGNEE